MCPWWNRESSRARIALIRLLAFAHKERLDYLPLIHSLAAEQRGAARRRLRKLEHRLDRGTPLIEALEQTPDVLNDEDLLAIRFANQSGTLPETFRYLLQRDSKHGRQTKIRVTQALAYAVCLAVFTSLALMFMMSFIAPTFQAIFESFGLRLPVFLRALISTYSYCAQYLPLLILAAVVAIVVAVVGRPQQWVRRTWLSKLLAPIAQLRIAQLQQLFAITSEAGRPLGASLSTLARFHFDKNMRLKLLEARNNVEQGSAPWISLAEVQLLPEREAYALEHADSPEFRSWLLRNLAQWREEKVAQRAGYMSMILYPMVVIGFGLLILWIVTAFMSVVISMISALA